MDKRVIFIIIFLFILIINLYSVGNMENEKERILIVIIGDDKYEIKCRDYYLSSEKDWGRFSYTLYCYSLDDNNNTEIVFKAYSSAFIAVYWKEDNE